jgi:uncharacterized protein with ATP-grasp and redox domains
MKTIDEIHEALASRFDPEELVYLLDVGAEELLERFLVEKMDERGQRILEALE